MNWLYTLAKCCIIFWFIVLLLILICTYPLQSIAIILVLMLFK